MFSGCESVEEIEIRAYELILSNPDFISILYILAIKTAIITFYLEVTKVFGLNEVDEK